MSPMSLFFSSSVLYNLQKNPNYSMTYLSDLLVLGRNTMLANYLGGILKKPPFPLVSQEETPVSRD